MLKIKSDVAAPFTFRAVFIGALSLAVAASALIKSGDIVPALFLIPLNVILLWTYFDTWYELREDSLHIHFGPFRRSIKYKNIAALSIPYSYLNLTLMGLSHTCIALKLHSGFPSTVCISPEKTYRVFDMITEKCGNLTDD
ncbi:MAG: PH domain-containing protein [Oscillospiraceae bacterium]